jgi:hypothetical protein
VTVSRLAPRDDGAFSGRWQAAGGMVMRPVTEVRGTSVASARAASCRHAVARRKGRLRRVLLAPVYAVYERERGFGRY